MTPEKISDLSYRLHRLDSKYKAATGGDGYLSLHRTTTNGFVVFPDDTAVHDLAEAVAKLETMLAEATNPKQEES